MSLRAATVTLWAAVVLLVAASDVAYQTRMGRWMWLWSEVPIGATQTEQGFAFVGHTGRPELASHVALQSTALLEDGVQLGLRNAPHGEIREVGRGRYSFWQDYVLFATSDNSDPRTNGRRYTMTFSPISRPVARAIYGTTVLVFVLAIGLTWAAWRAGAIGVPPALVRFVRGHAKLVVTVLAAESLVLPALLRASASTSPLADDVWPSVLLLHVLLAIVVRVQWGSRVPTAVLVASLLALAIGYGVLTAWAPHRTQNCETNGKSYPVWAMYCVAPDSPSYYRGYDIGSTRQPLYPWFIGAITSGTGFNPQPDETPNFGEPRFDADPLFRVVRTQIVLLLAASILACAAFMRLLGSTLPAVIFLWLYDKQFFSAGELNFVLTEPLVQAFQFVLVAAFAICLWQLRGGWVVVAGAAAGLAYLTRQASAYSSMLLAFVIVMAMLRDHRRWWKVCTAALAVFAGLVSVPDVYALIKTGSLGAQQQNLQYQYRLAHAMQYATPEDLPLMPDEDSRTWLRAAMIRRDAAHRALEAKYQDEYTRMVYYVNDNLYVAAIPTTVPLESAAFYMGVTTPILSKHWRDYMSFAFRFWVVALEQPGVSRLGFNGLSPWVTYAFVFALALFVNGWRGLAGIALLLCHWAAVALACMFAAPIPRMVRASEFLVFLSLLLLVWSAGERLAPALWRRRAAAAA